MTIFSDIGGLYVHGKLNPIAGGEIELDYYKLKEISTSNRPLIARHPQNKTTFTVIKQTRNEIFLRRTTNENRVLPSTNNKRKGKHRQIIL